MEDIDKILKDKGYTEDEIKEIINAYGVKKMDPKILKKCIEVNYNFLISLGYSPNDIRKLTTSFPAIYTYSLNNLKEKVKNMNELGYSNSDIKKMSKIDSSIFGLSVKLIKQKIEDMVKMGYTEKDIIRMTKRSPSIYNLNIKYIETRIKDMESFGYSRKDVIEMTKKFPSIYTFGIKYINGKIEDIESLGYSREAVIEMSRKLPAILGYLIDTINQKIKDLKSLGYSQEEIIDMTRIFPAIFGYDKQTIIDGIQNLENLGYSRKQTLKITKGLPSILGSDLQKVKEKIEFYDSIGLHWLAIKCPKNLIQSTELSRARYLFFADPDSDFEGKRIECFNQSNFRRLFIDGRKFEKMYHISNEDLIKKYDNDYYQEYLKKMKEKSSKASENIVQKPEESDDKISLLKKAQELRDGAEAKNEKAKKLEIQVFSRLKKVKIHSKDVL